jgi:hypothetical protein
MSEAQNIPPEEFIPFMSFASFRDTHRELLIRRREEKKELGAESEDFWTAVLELVGRGIAAGAFFDEDEDRSAAQNLLDYWDTQLFHAGRTAPEASLSEFNPQLQPEITDDRCPYLGLDAFGNGNEHLFFGRDQLISELINQTLVSRLVAVIGPSGSGKSSAVLAGLLPKLKHGALPGSALWRYFPPIVPGSAPLTSLARLLKPEGNQEVGWLIDAIENLNKNPDHLAYLIEQITNAPAVIIVDQFEELFTLCHDEAEREAFINCLLHLIRSENERHLVILTMRVDYESYLNKTPILQAFIEQGEVRVTAMNAAELRDAIEQPAELVGLKFEDGLIDTLIREIIGEPAALPLLQFALLQLWDNRERNRVTWETYRRLGGVNSALSNTANHIYTSLLPEEQVTARRILLRLVRPSEGLEFTRYRIPRSQLYTSGEAHDRIDRVLNKLIQARLIRSTSHQQTDEEEQIEVAHEALVRNWPRLVEWLEDERVLLRHRLRLTDQAQQWDAMGRDDDALLRGSLLQDALQFTELSPLEEEYIHASRELEQREEAAKEAARQRELSQARALAAEQSRLAQAEKQRAEEQKLLAQVQATAAKRARNFNVALIVILVLVLVGAGIVINSSRTREEAQQTALSATAAAANAKFVELTATAVAATSTVESGQASQIRATAEAAQATATIEVAINQTQVAERQVLQSNATSTALGATVTAEYQQAASTATREARGTPPPARGAATGGTHPHPQRRHSAQRRPTQRLPARSRQHAHALHPRQQLHHGFLRRKLTPQRTTRPHRHRPPLLPRQIRSLRAAIRRLPQQTGTKSPGLLWLRLCQNPGRHPIHPPAQQPGRLRSPLRHRKLPRQLDHLVRRNRLLRIPRRTPAHRNRMGICRPWPGQPPLPLGNRCPHCQCPRHLWLSQHQLPLRLQTGRRPARWRQPVWRLWHVWWCDGMGARLV